jgi:hypothetical protein
MSFLLGALNPQDIERNLVSILFIYFWLLLYKSSYNIS